VIPGTKKKISAFDIETMFGGKKTRKAERKDRKERKGMKGGEAPIEAMEMPLVGGAAKTVGTRAEVMHGTAARTSGGLTRKDLKYNKHGRIVSRKASEAGKKALRRLTRAGYKARKGQFKLFRKSAKRTAKRSVSKRH
jgi:hypothetical protein